MCIALIMSFSASILDKYMDAFFCGLCPSFILLSYNSMSFIETVDLKCYMVTQPRPSLDPRQASGSMRACRVQICFEFFKDACWSLENKTETCREQQFPRLLFFFSSDVCFFFLSYYFYPYGPEFILGSFHTLGEGQNDFERPCFWSQLSDCSKLFQVEFPNVGTASLARCPRDFEGSVQKFRAGWAAGNWFRRSEMTQPLSHPFHNHGSVKKWVT